MPCEIIRLLSEDDLLPLARRLAGLLRGGDVVTLTGDLGAGKTTLCRALIRALGDPAEDVPSPTFTLVQVYDLPQFPIYHFDLYRLAEAERDILELGWDEARRFGVSLVEWPDRLGGEAPGGLLPRERLEITIRFVPDSDNQREVEIVPHGHLTARF